MHYILDWKDKDTMYQTGRIRALYARLEGYGHYIPDWKDMGNTYQTGRIRVPEDGSQQRIVLIGSRNRINDQL